MLHADDAAAAAHFKRQIREALACKTTQLNDAAHLIAHV